MPGVGHGDEQRDRGRVDQHRLSAREVQAGHVAVGHESAPAGFEMVEQLDHARKPCRIGDVADGDELKLARHDAAEVISDCHWWSQRERGRAQQAQGSVRRVGRRRELRDEPSVSRARGWWSSEVPSPGRSLVSCPLVLMSLAPTWVESSGGVVAAGGSPRPRRRRRWRCPSMPRDRASSRLRGRPQRFERPWPGGADGVVALPCESGASVVSASLELRGVGVIGEPEVGRSQSSSSAPSCSDSPSSS